MRFLDAAFCLPVLAELLSGVTAFGQDPPPPVRLDFNGDSETEGTDLQDADRRANREGVYTLRVRYVKVEGRWTGQVQLPMAVGDLLTREKVSESMQALRKTISDQSVSGYGQRSMGEIGVLYIAVEFDTSAPSESGLEPSAGENTVGVIFKPTYVRLSLYKIGNNVLPMPRAAKPTFYGGVPEPLLALQPAFGISHDRAFGTALSGSVDTDFRTLRPAAPGADPRHLELHAEGSKSMSELFYRADAGLRYGARRAGRPLQEWALRLDYEGAKEPLGDDENTHNAGAATGGMTFKIAPNTRVSVDTGYRLTNDKLRDLGADTIDTTTANEQTNRLLLDVIPRPIYGFLRAAVWEDNGWQSQGGGSYQPLVGRIGYAKEVPIGASQTIGIEIIGGGGVAWGDLPENARFFAGNSPGQFLYDSPSGGNLLAMPAGPLIRSFGQAEAGLRGAGGRAVGGDAFWHVNLNLTFPIRPWSRPLIPNEDTDVPDSSGNPVSLKKMLKNQIDVTGQSMLAAVLKNEGLTDAQAQAQAHEILEEIRPATHYIIDDANTYSIKPLLMFDVAGIPGSRGLSAETWTALGGGVQLTIVVARFEIGYMHTLSGPTFDDRGNVFVRLVFQNLF